MDKISITKWAAYFLGLALVTTLAYFPGLSGGFILDDFPNLSLLSQVPANHSLPQLISLSTNGISSAIGRPLSMLSFLLQAESWPGNPAAFKVINLVIHLCNGGILILLCQQLARARGELRLSKPFLFGVVALWLLHPIHVSNVLYVVQRMNLLSSMFVLIGILAYLWSRNQLTESKGLRYGILMVTTPIVFSILGVLSKENGALLYLYLLAIELTLLNHNERSNSLFRAKLFALFIPLAIGIAAFLLFLPSALDGFTQKPFTLTERSLTQFPILLSYLGILIFPIPDRLGLFHDSIPVFSSPFSLAVLVSGLLIVSLLIAAYRFRQQNAILAFGVLWFFFGHALESTILPLELYFEHRNYLPSFGLFLSFALFLQKTQASLPAVTQRLVGIGAIGILLTFGLFTANESSVWGDALRQANVEVERRPASHRAQSYLIQTLTSTGNPIAGFELHQELISEGSVKIGDYIRWLEFGCILPDIQAPDNETLTRIARDAAMDYSAISQLNRIIPAVIQDACPAILLPKLIIVVDTLQQNPNFEISWPDLLYARATIAYSDGNIAEAGELAARSYDLRPDVSIGLMYMNWLVEMQRGAELAEFLTVFQSDFTDEIDSREGLAARVNEIRNTF